jgi:site-specific DNA recombinase
MLSNRGYIGEAAHKGDSYPGEHDAMIDRDLWDKVHAILQESPRKRAMRKRADTPALLKGLLFGPDGAAFWPTHTRKGGQLYRYYVSQTVLKHGAGLCPVSRVPAGEIEAAVIDQRCAVFRQPEIVAGTFRAARAKDDDITEAEARAALQQLDPLRDELFPAEHVRIVALLVERVNIGADELNVRLCVNGARSRILSSICSLVLIYQTWLGRTGGFAPTSFRLFQGMRAGLTTEWVGTCSMSTHDLHPNASRTSISSCNLVGAAGAQQARSA